MLPSRSGRAWRVLTFVLVLTLQLAMLTTIARAQKTRKRKKKGAESGEPATPTPPSAMVPLPIGHEAKGLVFPDIDENGNLRGRFSAGTAKRIDQNHMQFHDLKITTFNDQKQTDLVIEMSQGVLDMDTRVLSSPTATRVRRTDFDVIGDAAEFDTIKRQGTITGHVKMTITDAQKYSSPRPSSTPKS